jgi:NADP-reducing hydrogenase subunit HndB
MIKIKSFEKLIRPMDTLIGKRNQMDHFKIAHVIVGMGDCGIAAGSRNTLQAILNYAIDWNMNKIIVVPGGCIGHCEQEPIVQVRFGDEPFVVYGRVNPEIAVRILKEYVCEGKIVEEYVIDLG